MDGQLGEKELAKFLGKLAVHMSANVVAIRQLTKAGQIPLTLSILMESGQTLTLQIFAGFVESAITKWIDERQN